jgi:hypothetical protein
LSAETDAVGAIRNFKQAGQIKEALALLAWRSDVAGK